MLKRVLIISIITTFFIYSCGKDRQTGEKSKMHKILTQEEINSIIDSLKMLPDEPVTENEKAVIETNLGTIEFEFYPHVAPNHCANFKKLANSGFYDGTTFHRVIPGFMIQGGDIRSRDADPMNDGTGGIGYYLNAEFSDIHHDRGIVSTARGPEINSAGSQFFICVANKRYLDGQYTVFGKVNKGMEVVDKIIAVPRDGRDRPFKNVIMEKVRVVKK